MKEFFITRYDAFDDKVIETSAEYYINLPKGDMTIISYVECEGRDVQITDAQVDVLFKCIDEHDGKMIIPEKQYVVFIVDGERIKIDIPALEYAISHLELAINEFRQKIIGDDSESRGFTLSLSFKEIELLARAKNISMYLSSEMSYSIGDVTYNEEGQLHAGSFCVSGPIQLFMQALYNHYVKPGTFPSVDLDRTMQELNHRVPVDSSAKL